MCMYLRCGLDKLSRNAKEKVGQSNILQYFYLDKRSSLLTGRMLKVVYEFFRLLDVHNSEALNGRSMHLYELKAKRIV